MVGIKGKSGVYKHKPHTLEAKLKISQSLIGNKRRLGKIPKNKKFNDRKEYYKDWIQKNREKVNLYHKNRYYTHNGREYAKNWCRKQRERLATRKRPECCEVCGVFGKTYFDHCHITNAFRGWLCPRCNTVLGMVKDNFELLLALVKYLNGCKYHQCNSQDSPTPKED